MQGKLTKRAVDALTSTQRDQFLWDTDLSGFGLKVTPKGKKVYLLQYRMGGRGTPAKRYTIGQHGSWTPDAARKEATRLLGLISCGTDPILTKSAGKAIPTLEQFSNRYLTEYAELHKKPLSVAQDRHNLQKHITPALGSCRVDKVERQDIARLHHHLRKTPIAANRVLALLSMMFHLAEKWGLRPDHSNPCRHVQKYKEIKRERFLNFEELERLGEVLANVEKGNSVYPPIITAIRLLIFTGARLSEILTLKWAYVDFEQQCLHLPDSKTGSKVIHLSPPAATLLAECPRLESNPYVIYGRNRGEHLKNIQRTWRDLRQQAKLDDVRIHDLRHSYASMGAGEGLSLPMIGALLGHKHASTTQRYAHLAVDPIKQANEQIGFQLEAALGMEKKLKRNKLKKRKK